jgi:hypothetical protein
MPLICGVVGLALAGSLLAVPPELAPDLTDGQKEQFLLPAKILERHKLSEGITGSERATLSDGQVTHDVHLQFVDIYRREFRGITGTQLHFRDSYKYNIAAYRLDRMLGLNMVPVSVERKVGGRTGAVTWWVDDVLMSETKRIKNEVEPPDVSAWNDQVYQTRVFYELVHETDYRNFDNVLITNDWKLWMIDFTRAFRTVKALLDKRSLVRIDRRFYEGLKALNQPALTEELGSCLTNMEIRGLLARRELILEIFDKKIAEKGESAVICDKPGH